MERIARAKKSIRKLAIEDRPGGLVLAEHAIDLHAELFNDAGDRLIALDALARDLIRLRHEQPELADFLKQVDDYIQLVQQEMCAAPPCGSAPARA